MTIPGPDERLAPLAFLSLVREIAADAATQTDPDACLRHLRAGLLRLGFKRAGIWVIDPEDGSQAHGTWGTNWDGTEFDEHELTKPVADLLGVPLVEAGQRPIVNRLSRPGDLTLAPDRPLSEPDGLPNHASVSLRADGMLLGIISVDMLTGDETLNLEHLAALELLADVVAVAIARGRLVESFRITNEELRESDGRFRFMAEATGAAMYRLRYDSQTYEYLSPIVENLTGFSVEEINNGAWHKIIRKVESIEGHAIIDGAVRSKHFAGDDVSYHANYLIQPKSGNNRWLEDRSVPWRDNAGHVIGSVGLLSDITERQALEERLRQAQKMEAIGQLAGGVAHDFNNLLTVICGYGEVLLNRFEPSTPEYAEMEQIMLAGESATSLTRQLLAFSRRQLIAPQATDLNIVVEQMGKMLRRLIGEDITFATILAPNLDHARVDVGQIEQVLLNLATNARDAMPVGGKLTLETGNVFHGEDHVREHVDAQVGPHVMVSVTDTGIGMDASTLAHVFEPFFTTKEVGRGTGLGLAAVYGIVKQSGGSIELSSVPGRGTTFKLYFPRAEADSVRSSSEPPARVFRGNETILLVEDDNQVRMLARVALEAAGYRVLEAAGGVRAIDLVAESVGSIDMLVTDVVMPGLSGRRVAQTLVEQDPRLKVLFVSGYTDDLVVRHGVVESAVAFLQKPFTPTTLTRKVRDVLDGFS